jgi:hypothetical protein
LRKGEAGHQGRGETVHQERGETVIERGSRSSMLWGRTMNFHIRKFKVHMKSEFERTYGFSLKIRSKAAKGSSTIASDDSVL